MKKNKVYSINSAVGKKKEHSHRSLHKIWFHSYENPEWVYLKRQEVD